MDFSKILEIAKATTLMPLWLKNDFQKCITHGSSFKIDPYQATLKYHNQMCIIGNIVQNVR